MGISKHSDRLVFSKLALVIFLALLLVSCNEDISSSHRTLASAKEGIEHGWIPAILPPSTNSIRETHNLDDNTGYGSFGFDTKGYEAFSKQLQPFPKEARPHGPTLAQQEKLGKKGYFFFQYSDEKSKWIFAIHPQGHAQYWFPYEKRTD